MVHQENAQELHVLRQNGPVFWEDTEGIFYVPMENTSGQKFHLQISSEEVIALVERVTALVLRSGGDTDENQKRNAGLLEGVSSQELEGEIYGK